MSEVWIDRSHQTDSSADTPLLVASGLHKRFGSLVAVNDLTFDIGRGELFGIAGPNGAGKSTLLNICTGQISPDTGSLLFDGEEIAGKRPDAICHAGVARTFQIPMIFESLSVRENVEIGAMFGGPELYQGRRSREEIVETALEATGLADRTGQRAGTLALLARKRTMLAAALATQPRLIFMDEPLGGLTIEEVDDLVAVIRFLHEQFGVTFALVEHKIRALTELSDRIMIMHYGSRICLDVPEVVVKNEQVIEVYLGNESLA